MKSMKCLNDKAPLKEATLSGIKVDACEECKGTWFDADELRRAKDSADDDLRWLDFELFGEKEGKYLSSKADTSSQCPECAVPLTALEYADSKVIVDACRNGHGEWLDSKEFDKIIKYLEKVVVTKPASEYFKDAAAELKEVATGKEGLVSEIKDFLAISKLYRYRLAAENPEATEKYNTFATYFRI